MLLERYQRKEMAEIWSLESKFSTFLKIEILAAQIMAKRGEIPEEAPIAIEQNAKFDIAQINEIEKEVKHDVIAFLTNVAQNVGPMARYMHQGLTSSDIIDSAFSYQLKKATQIILADIQDLLKALKERAYESKNMPRIGRSHGIHAEPTTMGLTFARFYAEFKRHYERLEFALKDVARCAISGPVGTFSSTDPQVEAYIAEKLGLQVEPISTQVIPRDRHAFFFATIATIASSIENIATEIRHMQRTELREAEEFFAKGQKGSSAMPHKRNPVLSENLTGLARLIRSTAYPAQENVALWHERDISHSSVERVIAPEATILLDFALSRLTNVVSNLTLYPENMAKALNQLKGLPFSQNLLLALTQKNISREDAYRIVQKHAMRVWNNEGEFKELLLEDEELMQHFDKQELDRLFDVNHALRNVDVIFDRVFTE